MGLKITFLYLYAAFGKANISSEEKKRHEKLIYSHIESNMIPLKIGRAM